MESKRNEYNVRRLEVEKVRELLGGQSVENLASLDSRIQLVVGKIGAEKAGEFLGNEFAELAFEDSKAFKSMVDALRNLQDVRTRPSTLAQEREFRTQLHGYGISETEYFTATKDGLTIDSRDNLSKLARAHYGRFKKALDFVSFKKISRGAGRKLYGTLQEQKAIMDESDTHMKAVGKVLRMTLNEDTRLAIQRFMLEGGTIEEKKEKQTISTIADYRKAKNEYDSAGVQKRFDAYKAAEGKKRNIKDFSKQPHVFEELKETFSTQEDARQSQNGYGAYKAKGLFAILMTMIFRTKDDIKASLK